MTGTSARVAARSRGTHSVYRTVGELSGGPARLGVASALRLPPREMIEPLRIVSYNVRYFGHALRGLASTRTGKRAIARAIASLR